MLLQFNVTNFLSFKNEVVLSAISNVDKTHDENLLVFQDEKVLPTLAIYGANASGKTNINKALVSAILFIRNSNLMQVNSKINVTPFLFDETTKNQPTKFDFIFVYNEKKYVYGFTANQEKVYEEYLYEYNSAKPTKIFERTNVNEYSFTTSTKKDLSQIVEKNTDNKLFLATATAWNSKLTKEPYLWFTEGIDVYDTDNLEEDMLKILENDSSESTKKFMNQLLQQADINISDYEFETRQVSPSEFGIQFDEPIKQWKIVTHHKINNGMIEKDYELPYRMESKGTQTFFSLGPIIKESLEKGKTIIIDEIDTGLHPLLTRYLIELFHNSKQNPKAAQLIFNTHDITLLDLDLFRRDQIYFVEKNNETGVSDLYSLDEYSPRKTENIQKGYIQGRYGAIPCIGFGEIKW